MSVRAYARSSNKAGPLSVDGRQNSEHFWELVFEWEDCYVRGPTKNSDSVYSDLNSMSRQKFFESYCFYLEWL
jgi:hypothetical protein